MNTPSFARWFHSNVRPKQRGNRRFSPHRRRGRRLGLETLEVRALLTGNPLVEIEPNDQMDQATELGTGDQSVAGAEISGADDKDLYRWTAPHSGSLNIDLLFEAD